MHNIIMTPTEKLFEFRQLGPNDVLLGRGTGPNEYIGNIRFRDTVRAIIEDSNVRRRVGRSKAELANIIVARIKELGGKFVKKVRLGASSTKATGSYSEEVYQEVCDSVACNKVTQCIRHQLLRFLCPPEPKKSSLTSRKFPPCSSEPQTTPASKPPCNPAQPPPLFPGLSRASSLSRMLLSSMSGDLSCASSRGDLAQHHLESSPVASSEYSQAHILEEHLAALHSPSLIRQRHGVLTTALNMDEVATPHGTRNHDHDILMHLLQKQESTLLQDALIVRRNKNKILEEQISWLGASPPLVTSPLGALSPYTTLQTLLAQELASHHIQSSSGGAMFPNRPSPMMPPPFF
jgi:hypothetical protein